MATRKTELIFAAFVVLVGACSHESLVVQTPPPPSGFANSTNIRPVPAPVVPATFSGSLPKALDQMSGKDLYDFVAAMPRGRGMDADRKCKGVGCFFGGGKTKVGIESAADAMYLNATNPGADGTIAAVAVNKGKYPSARYDFQPNQGSKKHLYAFIVFPKGVIGGPKYVVEDIIRDGGSYSHNTVVAGDFVLCNHDTWWTESQAAFQNCNGTMSKGTAGTGIVTMGFDLFAAPKAVLALVKSSAGIYEADDTPGWISCASGCCTFGSALTN